MTLRILRAVTTLPVKPIFRLLENLCARFFGALEMLIHIWDIDVEALRGLAQPFRVSIFCAGISHHDQIGAELHGGVIDLAVPSSHGPAMFSEAKRLRKKSQRG